MPAVAVRRRSSVVVTARALARNGDMPARAGGNGVALNMAGGGGDADDAAFERY
jgi:hypothetical protein